MVQVNWSRRPIKALVRTLVATACGKGKKHALLFPADHAKDVLALQGAGVVNGLTKLTLVEKSPSNMTKALRAIARFGLGKCKGRKPSPWRDMLHKLPLSASLIRSKIPGYVKTLDFAWFDYCGFFMNHEAQWTSENARFFMQPGSDVLFTFQAVIRGRAVPTVYFTRFESGHGSEIRAEIRDIGKLETMHVRDDGSIYSVPASPKMLRALAIRRIGIRKLLTGWTFDIKHTTYKDRDPQTQDDRGPGMILLHLTNIRPA
jgi:hypothetical protein